jgi:hypothetical protein
MGKSSVLLIELHRLISARQWWISAKNRLADERTNCSFCDYGSCEKNIPAKAGFSRFPGCCVRIDLLSQCADFGDVPNRVRVGCLRVTNTGHQADFYPVDMAQEVIGGGGACFARHVSRHLSQDNQPANPCGRISERHTIVVVSRC